MGRGDNRRSPKMCRAKGVAKRKERAKRVKEAKYKIRTGH